MMDILEVFSSRAWQHLIAALLHTLWQGAVLAALLSVAMRRLPAYRHDARYLLALAAQFGMLLAGLATWSVLEDRPAQLAISAAASMVRPPASSDVAGSASGSVPAALAAAPSAARLGPAGAPRWVSIIALAWLTGVAVMLGRTAGSVWSASKLARGPLVSDPAILGLVETARKQVGIRRMIRVVEAGVPHGPAVLGVLWPTLLLPAAAMAGLPPDALQAVLIHELAHVRRYDYLVNIAQMVVESVLFFNPAVWWLGRQARLEREACCDATAVRLTGRPIEYSRSLAEWAGRSRIGSVAAAWAGDRRTGTLLERVRRVLRPGERPAARVSPSGLVLLLIGGPVLLVILWRGTGAAVGIAAQILSPAERIQRLEATQAEYAPPLGDPEGKGTLKGTIRTADGKPPARPIRLSHRTDRSPGGRYMGTLGQYRDEFSVEVPAGTTWLTADPDDHAPAIVGPFETRPGKTIDGIRIVVGAGFPARIAVIDGRGVAVPGARVSAHLIIDGNGSIGASNGWITDRDGIATIPHAVAKPYHVTVTAAGFVPLESVQVTPSADQTKVLTVTRARPSRGVAVDPQGKPVAGAEVRVYFEGREGSTYFHGSGGPLLTTTDEAGRFTLDTLKDRTNYIVFVVSKAGGRGISPKLRAGQDGIRVTVGPKLTIQGTIKPGTDEQGKSSMPATVDVTQFVRVDLEHEPFSPVTTRIPVDRQGRFTATDLLPCETRIEAAGRTVPVPLDRPETSVTIDLTRPPTGPPTRRVVLRVVTPDGAIPQSGRIDAYAYRPGERQTSFSRELTLDRGHASFDAPVAARLTYRLQSMVGYWFKDGDVEVEPGEGEKIIDIPALPAGAIAGRVLDSDGKPAVGGDISCRTVEPAAGLQGEVFIKNNLRGDAQGRFFASPLPLGGSYVVIAGRGHNRQVSPPVRLDVSQPTGRITLKMARDAVAEGRVVGPDGRPLAGVPVGLELVHPTAGGGWGPPTPTDDEGRFRFDDLSPELDGYRAIVEAPKGYQPADARLRPGGPPVGIRLERGHVIEGRVLDAKTGRPIPGISIYAQRPEWAEGRRNSFEAEAKTDEQGRFRFSNLPEGSWRLNDRSGLEWESPHKTHIFGVDGPEPIEIRAAPPAWGLSSPPAPGRA
jgi:beta-lactamase regulating signal transducer with metallopeptidase domain